MRSLLLHPMRSLLTVLGILIGVTSVIWLLAISEGISKEFQRQIEDLGAENIIVRSIKPPDEDTNSLRQFNAFGVTRAEFKAISQTIPTVDRVLPIRELTQKFANMGNSKVKAINGRLVGCTPAYAEVTRLVVSRGHFLTMQELENNANVCVIAATLAQKLFPSEDPLKKEIYFPENKVYYEIVGVLEPRNATAAIGGSLASQDFSLDVYIPITTMRVRLGDEVTKRAGGSFSRKQFELSQITVQVKDVDDVPQTAELVEATLRRKKPDRQDFAVVVPYELLEQAKTTRLMFMMFMCLIAAISLVVGGIGIMNIMLATVTERTREIGIRRALGAKRADITQQFLVETITLSVVGGLTGILLGLLGPLTFVFTRDTIVQKFAPNLYNVIPEVGRVMSPEIVPASIPVAFFISVAVGVLFGLYPAMRAAQMDPIEALRHE